MKRIFVLIFLLCSASAPYNPAFAETNKSDLLVGMKTLPLLTNKITGNVKVAIIYDANNNASKEEAIGIKSIFESGLEIPGDVKLVGTLVAATSLQDLSGKQIAILTEGLSKYFDVISHAAINNHILTMSTDLACVQADKCILGIVSKPNVEIYYSEEAADAAKVSFGSVFAMLVKQI